MEESINIANELGEIATVTNTIWVLVATVLVMFMQPGFAMVEAGFTRAKNSANILMKNLMDFSFGALVFWLIGYTIMYGTDIGGIIGKPDLFFNENGIDGIPNKASLMFQTVFAATAATIVSGSMAERTKFTAYIIFSITITLIIYPVSGHWIWSGDGWLAKLGFHDFAGSTVVHSVGGWIGLIGASIIGPRLGKYINKKTMPIPGHNLTLAALGVFILWFGWFGFNPGSQLAASSKSDALAISHIFITTNLAAAGGAVTAMIVAWSRYKRPILSFALNGALGGLVAITAGCDIVSPGGAVIIGIISGFILPFGVEFIENKLRVDDPVGAVTVHGVCGAIGTILVGFFATEGGVFYGGGFELLGVQIIGVLAVAAWAMATAFILFNILKASNGLRVEKRIEEEGLDIYEHGETAYNM